MGRKTSNKYITTKPLPKLRNYKPETFNFVTITNHNLSAKISVKKNNQSACFSENHRLKKTNHIKCTPLFMADFTKKIIDITKHKI